LLLGLLGLGSPERQSELANKVFLRPTRAAWT
jgi:hypothetical protein